MQNIMKHHSGFTLIEVAIVMVIIGLALAASIAPLSSQIERSKIAETDAILNDVMEALYGFAAVNGRLPCPAQANTFGNASPLNGSTAGVPCATGSIAPPNGVVNGFVPARTLGINGKYNADNLLLDAWNNPIRYTITQSNHAAAGTTTAADFTTLNEMRAVNITRLNPNLVICNTASALPNVCSVGNTLAQNAVAVILSLGKDGNRAVTGGGAIGADQSENTINGTRGGGPSAVTYRVNANNNRVFVSKTYNDNAANAARYYNDQIKWMSPNTLYAKMIAAGQLP